MRSDKFKFKVGDKVRFASTFLDSIHEWGSLRRQRGWVIKVETFPEFQLVTVQWDHGGVSKSLSTNLDL